MERERDVGLESAGLVLQAAQAIEVVDAFFDGFDVSVQHGAVRAQTGAVHLSRDREPLIAADLEVVRLLPHALAQIEAADGSVPTSSAELTQVANQSTGVKHDILIGIEKRLRQFEGDHHRAGETA